jgi:hypothetical protein
MELQSLMDADHITPPMPASQALPDRQGARSTSLEQELIARSGK